MLLDEPHDCAGVRKCLEFLCDRVASLQFSHLPEVVASLCIVVTSYSGIPFTDVKTGACVCSLCPALFAVRSMTSPTVTARSMQCTWSACACCTLTAVSHPLFQHTFEWLGLMAQKSTSFTQGLRVLTQVCLSRCAGLGHKNLP